MSITKMSFNKAQEIIDEHKQAIPDGVYKQLSDLFMKGHNEAKDCYEVTYLESFVEIQDEDDEEDFFLSIPIKKRILHIRREDYMGIKEQIDHRGFALRFDVLPNKYIILHRNSDHKSFGIQRKIIAINPVQ